MFKIPRDKCSSVPMKSPTKKAFTLAEVMIVLTIIGILSAILLPSAIHSTPDKNILKFKKAHNTLYSAVREMVNSDKYYSGSFFAPVDGFLDDPYSFQYFCQSFADIVSTKEVSCHASIQIAISNTANEEISTFEGRKKNIFMDKNCTIDMGNWVEFANYIVGADNVVYYGFTSGFAKDDFSCERGVSFNDYNYKYDKNGFCTLVDDNGFDVSLTLYCIDIDGHDGPIKPFGYGIRSDGKIVSGARADWWLSRDITKKETDCCPKDLNTNGLCDEGDTVCE